MIELLNFIFSSFRNFIGTIFLIGWIGVVICFVIYACRSKTETRYHLQDKEDNND